MCNYGKKTSSAMVDLNNFITKKKHFNVEKDHLIEIFNVISCVRAIEILEVETLFNKL